MKRLLTVSLVLMSLSLYADESVQVLTAEPINVDGFLNDRPVQDTELESIKAEITKQKNEIVLNREKAKNFRELSKSTVALSETTEEMLEGRNEAKAEIAAYNLKVKCMQSETPGPECDKHTRRRK